MDAALIAALISAMASVATAAVSTVATKRRGHSKADRQATIIKLTLSDGQRRSVMVEGPVDEEFLSRIIADLGPVQARST